MAILGPSVPEGKELIHAGNTPVSIFSDIIHATLKYGPFEYLIGGPALTADTLGLKTTAKKGKLYILFANELKILECHFSNDPNFKLVPNTPLGPMYIKSEYAVAIINLANHGMGSIKKEDMLPLSIDCLARPMSADKANGIQGGLYILKPTKLAKVNKETPSKIELTHQSKQQAYIYGPFVQIYAKCYLRMGLDICESVLKHIFRIRCAQSYCAPNPSEYLAFRDSFINERITQTI